VFLLHSLNSGQLCLASSNTDLTPHQLSIAPISSTFSHLQRHAIWYIVYTKIKKHNHVDSANTTEYCY